MGIKNFSKKRNFFALKNRGFLFAPIKNLIPMGKYREFTFFSW